MTEHRDTIHIPNDPPRRPPNIGHRPWWLFICVIAVSMFSAAAKAELIHRYSFNDGTAKDSVGHADGKLKGTAATVADGKLTLKNADKTSNDANLSYVDFGSSLLPKTGSVSLVVWFGADQTGAFARILNIGDQDAGEGRAFIYLTPHIGDEHARAAITATDAAAKTAIDTDPLDDGKAHMAALVVDGATKKLHLFIDGKEPVAAADLGANTLDKVRPVNAWIGRSAFDNDAGLTGSIDEFRVYDNAISADDAAAMFKAGPDQLPAGAK